MRGFDRWLFGFGSPACLGLFRAVFASVVFASLSITFVGFGDWYTEHGFFPVSAANMWTGGGAFLSPLSSVSDEQTMLVFYGATMVAALLTAVGLWTRVSCVALLIGVVALHHRSPLILHSGDTLVRSMLFLLALSPCGRAFSLDRVMSRKHGGGSELRSVSLWPQRLMQIQVAVLYIATVWHKTQGTTWMDGTATHYPLNIAEFVRFPVPGWFDAQPAIGVMTWGTLIVELALGTLVFSRPMRKYVLFAGLLLHAGIEYMFNIPMFAFIIVSCYLLFYEGFEVEAWCRRVGELTKARRSVTISEATGT